MNLRFITDTSTLCVFDPASLKHRLDDDADWWSVPDDEIAEVNLGNVAFVGLGADGLFDVNIVDTLTGEIRIMLKCPSGRVFIGAGEEVTSEGLEPASVRGGGFYEIDPGAYVIHAALADSNRILLSFVETTDTVENRFLKPVSLVAR